MTAHNRITFIGHATVLVEIDGVRILPTLCYEMVLLTLNGEVYPLVIPIIRISMQY